ncbi:hypothetical protein [Parachitinimonas caeni]|uniref:Uncharacterized protein n=1 Tax=Parachitinimonas caeni TaxID=3031301 RepID=A0ABT7E335_9NEIS|nr:hypothetical protein [Parachitinimonas caeni]MDK2126738.1 hypothetical protein [Parachitinimonas caeni]
MTQILSSTAARIGNSAPQLALETYYTLQNPANSNFLSWQGGGAFMAKQAIIYPTAKDLWFSDPAGADSGLIVTGQNLYIKISVTVHLWLAISTPPTDFAQWANIGGEDIQYEWQLYVDDNLTPNLPIYLGQQPLYIQSVAFPGYFLAQIPNSQDPSWVSVTNSPFPWGVEQEGGEG